MGSSQPPLSPLADPLSLARLQVLIIPVHRGVGGYSSNGAGPSSTTTVDEDGVAHAPLTEEVYDYWNKTFRKVSTLRGDEIVHDRSRIDAHGGPHGMTHRRGQAGDGPQTRNRFIPQTATGSISRAGSASYVHLSYPTQPPAKHLYPLSLLRMSAFPLVVIGVAADDGQEADGYDVPGSAGGASLKPKDSPTLRNSNSWAQQFDQTLADFLPPTAAFPLVKRLVLVPSSTPTATGSRPPSSAKFGNRASWIPSPFICRAPHDAAEGWVSKLMGEVIGQVFGELGELAASLESPAGLQTLSGTLLPSLSATMPQQEQYSSSPVSEERLQSPGGSASSTPRPPGMVHSNSLPIIPQSGSRSQSSFRALTPGGRPTTVQGPSAPPIPSAAITPTQSASSNPFRRSAALIGRSTSTGGGASPSTAASLAKDPTGLGKYTTAPLTGIAGGRLLKLLGDIYLLTGGYADAIRCYDEGAERSRSVGDVLWEALAREGRGVAGIGEAWEGRDGSNNTTPFPTSPIPVEVLSHFLSSLACLTRAPLPFPPTILSPAPQTPDGNLTIPSAAAAHPTNIGTGEGLLAYLYATLCLRIGHFALFIFAAGGWGSIAVSSLISHALPRSFPAILENKTDDPAAARRRRIILAQLAASSQLPRSNILGHAEAALAPFRLAMTKAEQLAVHIEVVWLARWLEMERKEARVTREVIKLLSTIIVAGREESSRLTARRASVLSTPGGSGAAVAFRQRELTEGNAGVMELIQRVCAALGVDILSAGADYTNPVIQVSDEFKGPHFGWADLQVETLKEAIAVTESLPDHPSVIRLCLSALHSLHGYLSPANQAYLAKLYPKALSTIRRRAIDFEGIPWWLPRPVVLSVEVSSLPANRIPIEHTHDEIAGQANGGGRKDPFLYNPRLKSSEAGKTVLVANEQADVFVTLQNVFAFDLEIQDLSLLTSGAPFVTTPLPLILPASSVQTVRVTGVAPNAGLLEIRGVNVRLTDGSQAEFLLPVIDSAEQKRDSKRRSRIIADAAKTKRQGLEARRSLQSPSPLEGQQQERQPNAESSNYRWLQCQVAEEQPLLWIKRTSLSHGTVMLYNGETSTIRITLENTSSVPVDFVKLSFEDSVTREAQAILTEGEVSPEQAYELDYDSVNRPVFSWDNDTELTIPPNGRVTLNVQCLGKVGCTDALIRIDYGYVKREGGVAKTFHTRQLAFPVLFTVYHTLECYGVDLASIRSSESHIKAKEKITMAERTRSPSGTFATSADQELRSALAQSSDRNVLYCINVRNMYSVPFEVALSTKPLTADGTLPPSLPLVVTRLVPPGATERLVLPIQRQSLTQEERSRPIPTPSGRQYVVDKTKKTAEEVARQRELFWFRERLQTMVDVSWRDPGSLRSGSLSLRDQPLSATQLESLRLDELAVSLAVGPRDGSGATGADSAIAPPKLSAMDFVDLRITVANHLERAVRPYVRLEALPTSSADVSWSAPAPSAPRRVSSLPAAPVRAPKTVVFDGVLSAVLPSLEPGESATHQVGAVLLASGSYTFRAAAEEVVAVQQAFTAVTTPPIVRFSPSVSIDVA